MSYPNNRHGNTPPYLLSAYGIAVKHGYSGSEEEWLASLKGDQGEYPRMQFDSETGYLQIRYDDSGEWTDIASLADLMTESEETVVASAKEYADLAEAYAKGTVDDEDVEEGDPGYEDNAKYYAGQASTYASAAGGFATGASNYAQAASGYATTASGHADNAAASATAAAGSASDAAGSATSASTSAGSAATSALSAQAQATQAGTYAYNADQSAQQAASYAAAANTAYGAVVDVANAVDVKVEDIETQVSIAAGYATNAGTSATNAATSATAASGSATAAAGSATTASGYASAAAASAVTAGENAEAWAVGTRGGQPVPQTDDAYENNSKYYAEQAADVAESIPEDYSELSDDVADLKSANNRLATKYADAGRWTLGTFWGSGAERNVTNAMRTQYLPSNALAIEPDSGYKVLICCWDGSTYKGAWNGTTFSSTGTWFTTKVDLAPILQYKIRVVVALSDDSDMTIATDGLKIYFYDTTDTSLSAFGAIADAETVGKNIRNLESGVLPIDIEMGGMASDGNKYNLSNRVRTPEAIHFDKDTYIKCTDVNYMYSVYEYSNEIISSASYIGYHATQYGSYLCKANKYYGISIAKRDESTISDLSSVTGKLVILTDAYMMSAEQYTIQRFAPFGNVRRKIAGHRGLTINQPENTTASFEAAGTAGMWAIETDVNVTSDGYLICIHDDTLDRTTTGTGDVSSHTLAEIEALNIKDHPDLKVPTLEQYLSICKTYDCVALIEIKNSAVNQTSISKLIDTVVAYGMESKTIFISTIFSIGYVQAKNTKIPNLIIINTADFENGILTCKSYINTNVCLDGNSITLTHEHVKAIHDAGMICNVFVVNTVSAIKDYLAMGVDIVTSDSVATF